MEKIKFVFLMLLLSISVGLKAQTVSGTYSDEYGRWNYSIRTNNEAQITGGSPHLGILKIPASVEQDISCKINRSWGFFRQFSHR